MPQISSASRAGFIRRTQYIKKQETRNDKQNHINNLLTQRAPLYRAEKCRRSFAYFMQYFWSELSADDMVWNWHLDYLTNELMNVAKQVSEGKPKSHDLIINIPPGTTKSITTSVMFPVWCWINWPWMKFIVSSYSGALALEHAEFSRELVRSPKFKQLFPHIIIKPDKDTKSNFRLIYTDAKGVSHMGGNRLSTSVGGTLTGFHGHILIVDDPLDPNRAVSETELKNANRWMEQTLSTRKINKAVTPTILIMQRLHQDDPSGHMLAKNKTNVKHISLPGEIRNYRGHLHPEALAHYYINDLLDPHRMPWPVLKDMEVDLGQYGYAGQVGQNPVPPGGGMFTVDHIQVVSYSSVFPADIASTVRYWDKAGTQGGGAYTAGVKMCRLKNGKFVIFDVKRGQWGTDQREAIIRQTAEADGVAVSGWIEQEPGSGGKESAEATIRRCAGYSYRAERPVGDKIYRADPFSVQVNEGNVLLVQGEWNHDFIEELRFFPFGTYKDQVDAASGAFAKLATGKKVWVL
ncbi:MAG: phage terminase large subunit [Acholeplasmataceae bacterium]